MLTLIRIRNDINTRQTDRSNPSPLRLDQSQPKGRAENNMSYYKAILLHTVEKSFLSNFRWARRLVGGYWEEWYADPINGHIWLHRSDKFTPEKCRPGGCAIWADNPRPRIKENFKK